jgi:hypothetical protein
MPFAHVRRLTALSALAAAVLCGCQGDDNTLPLPPDAGSDARADATTAHDGAAEASPESGATKDSPSGDTGSEADTSSEAASSPETDSSPEANSSSDGSIEGAAVGTPEASSDSSPE